VKRVGFCLLAFFFDLAAFAQTPPGQSSANPPSAKRADTTAAASTSAPGSTSTAPLPTADFVLAHYVRALGGEAALKKITSRSLRGTFDAPAQQVTGEAEIEMAAPDHFYSLVKISDDVRFIQAYDGKIAWSYDPQRGLRDLTGAELDQMRRSSQFEYELRFRELFPQVRVLEKTEEGDRAAWVVEATPATGSAEKFYFDTETGLMLRHDSLQAGFEGASVPVVHRYSSYVAVDGIQVPTLLRHSDPQIEWQVKFTEIHNNVPVDPAKFSKPPSQ